MKKRIAAAALAVVLMVNIVGDHTRARAEPATITALAAIGILAFNLLGLMSGRYDDTAEAIGVFLEDGVEGWQDAFIGSEDTPSWFATGWNDIFTACSDWFESGEISLDENGLIAMNYDQYLTLCNNMIKYVDYDIYLGMDVNHTLLSAAEGSDILIQSALNSISFYNEDNGISFIPCFYSSDEIYFSGCYIYSLFNYNDAQTSLYVDYYVSYKSGGTLVNGLSGSFPLDSNGMNGFFSKYKPYFSYLSNTITLDRCDSDGIIVERTGVINNWYTLDNGSLVSFNYADIGDYLNFGYLCVDGHARGTFYNNVITSYSATPDTSQLNDLSDPLAPVLDVTDNPSLIIDTDPDIVNPVDSVTVSDIPGQADIPLSDLMETLDLDIDIPSVLATKFPFCIPFDFIRILSVLCADPKAPVFVIPLSTDPENLKGFEGNQTIGDIPEDFTPMFEIDEEIVIDLSVIPLVQPVCYAIFIIGFVVMLIMITSKMINH